jgi:hypothetical protein
MDVGILKRVDTTIVDQHINRVMEWCAQNGMAGAEDLRTVIRLRQMCEILCITEAVHRFFHSEDSPIQNKSWDPTQLLDIQPLLVATHEHSTFAMGLFQDQFMTAVSYHTYSVRCNLELCLNLFVSRR